jgi:hypothetical protein
MLGYERPRHACADPHQLGWKFQTFLFMLAKRQNKIIIITGICEFYSHVLISSEICMLQKTFLALLSTKAAFFLYFLGIYKKKS